MTVPDLDALEKETLDALQVLTAEPRVAAAPRGGLTVEVAAVFSELRKLRAKQEAIATQIHAVEFAEARMGQDKSPGAAFNLGMARAALAEAAMGRTPIPAPDPRTAKASPNQEFRDDDVPEEARDRDVFRRGLAKGFAIRLRNHRDAPMYTNTYANLHDGPHDDLIEFLEEIAKP